MTYKIKRKKRLRRKKYFLEALNNAVKDVQKGKPLRQAALVDGVPASTLCRKVKYPENFFKKSGPPTVLSKKEEQNIVNWILQRAQTGSPVTKKELSDSVQCYLNKQQETSVFTKNRPGKHWFANFKKRYPNLSVRIAQNFTLARASVDETNLREWFATVKTFLEDKNLLDISPTRVFDCDESSIMLSPQPDAVLAGKGVRAVYQISSSSDKECLTTLFMYGADGTRSPPMILYKLMNGLPKEVLEKIPKGWGIGLSESGWMNTEIFFEYITNEFYPWLCQQNIEFPVLVYMDQHSSHLTLPLMEFCKEKQIESVALYPNFTHIIQSLDIAFFRPSKQTYKSVLADWNLKNPEIPFTKEYFAQVLKETLDAFAQEKNSIIHGFAAARLVPSNPDAVNYKVFDKKKGKKNEVDRSEESFDNQEESTKNGMNVEQIILKGFEDKLPLDLLMQFEDCEKTKPWSGSMDKLEMWLDL